MTLINPLFSNLSAHSNYQASRNELYILEAEIYFRLQYELKQLTRDNYKEYFSLLRYTRQMEDEMLDEMFVRCIINDILATNEYTITGIAYYTHIPEDVLSEIISGQNTNPSTKLLYKILELHRSVRSDLYNKIMCKILSGHKSD